MTRPRGVFAAAATPLREDLAIDLPKLAEHCRWLLGAGGCDGVNLLGTTGEATSFSVEQRLAAMTGVAKAGLPMARFMVGTGAAALDDAARLTAAARDLGFAGALLLPPFYYKGIDADSLAGYVGALIERLGAPGLRLYLYHIPQNSGVPWPVEVVERLHRAHPEVVVGLKDSAGDMAYAREVARRLPGFDVFPGSEGTLGEAKASGFAGCISATTNVSGPLARLAWREPESAAGKQALADALAIRETLAKLPLVAAVKATLAELRGDPAWRRLHPPLRALTDAEWRTLSASLAATGYGRLKAA
jgi:4-hydroxy-tetrahydrodipicolinate synthase